MQDQQDEAHRLADSGGRDGLTESAHPGELAAAPTTVRSGTVLPADLGTGRPLRPSPVRILLAEDDATNQRIALHLLRKLGLSVDVVANGAEALLALEAVPYDLVLMDVQMPELDGWSTTRAIRDPQATVLNRDVPIIAMTAQAMPGDRELCLASGMNDYVSKPIRLSALAAALDDWLPGGRLVTAAGTSNAAEATPAVTPADAEPAVFDHTAMAARLMGDESLLWRIVQAFLDHIPGQIEALRVSLAAQDAVVVARLAHSMRGAAATVSAEGMRQMAEAMEEAGRHGDLGAVAIRLPDLVTQFDLFRDVVDEQQRRARSLSEGTSACDS